MVAEKVFIVDMREDTARGVCQSPEQGEKVLDWTWPVDWTGP